MKVVSGVSGICSKDDLKKETALVVINITTREFYGDHDWNPVQQKVQIFTKSAYSNAELLIRKLRWYMRMLIGER